MAEFCIGCLNKLSNQNYREKDYILAEGFCAGCGKTALVVVRERRQERIFNPIEYFRKK